MSNSSYPIFTEEMKRSYTILVPTMLPIHFSIIIDILSRYGYKAKLLENKGDQIKRLGLKYVNNDTCYPAQVVIGQMLDAIESGDYDKDKIALLISQTGGGCRASNYIFLLRKALKKAGYGQIPVISFNVSGLDTKSAFKLTLPMIHRMLYAVMYGDLLMSLNNQTKPYEIVKGTGDRLVQKWTRILGDELANDNNISYSHVKENYDSIIKSFSDIPRHSEKKKKVGIVGEIFVKFSPLGNNDLEEFLFDENVEVVMPGLLDFCLYCVYNGIVDTQLYGINRIKSLGSKIVYNFLISKQRDVIDAIKRDGTFSAPTLFSHTCTLAIDYIGLGAKMGEGWLLTAEMIELIEQGVSCIVCAQPFGCLPNHIVGKGMMKPIKERHPDVNIVAIDYDAGVSRINQQNRIKLMLANSGVQEANAEV